MNADLGNRVTHGWTHSQRSIRYLCVGIAGVGARQAEASLLFFMDKSGKLL